MTSNGDLQAVRIRIWDNTSGNDVYDFTSPLADPKKELKDFKLNGFGSLQYYQLTKKGETEWTFSDHTVRMELIGLTLEQVKQLSENP